MNLFSFIDKYGGYTFDEEPFTEVDNIIMSMLSYLDLKKFVSSDRYNPKKISEVGDEFFLDYDKKVRKVLAIRNAVKILKNIKDTKRYKDLLLYNYVYETNGESQFGAMSIEINKNLVYVSFEGTDHLIGGWKEDFMLSYMFPVLSQKRAINYVNKNFTFVNKKIILGGHSKGGNLALVAGMKANFIVKRKIINVYNNDGPGLLTEQFESKSYKSIYDRLITIVPNYSVVGLLMRHSDNIDVVRSFRRSIFSHDPVTWVVKDKKFERSFLNPFSIALDKDVDKWLLSYDMEERKMLVNTLFGIFDTLGINSLLDFVNNKKLIFKIINETKEFDEKTVIMLKSFVRVIFKAFSYVTKEEIKSIFFK